MNPINIAIKLVSSFSVLLLFLIIFQVFRSLTLVLYYDLFQELSFQEIVQSFVLGIRFDLSVISVFLGIPLLLLILPFRFSDQYFYQVLFHTIIYLALLGFIIFLAADLLYFSYVKRHITNEIIFLLNDTDYLLSEAKANGTSLAGLLLLALLGYPLYLRFTSKYHRPQRHSMLAVVLLFLLLVTIARGGFQMKPLSVVDAYQHGNSAMGNLALNGLFTASQYSITNEWVQRKEQQSENYASVLGFNNPANPEFPFEIKREKKFPRTKAKNLVILMVESLTTKYVDSLANNNYKVTPNLDRLVHEGVSFVNFFASGQRSVDGIQSIVTGVPPLPGMPNITSLSANYSRLAKLAETNGYQHIFITTTHREAFYLDAIAAAAGFSEYYGKEDFPIILDYPNDRDRWVGWDYEALMYLLQQIEEMQAPYFAFVNASADHTPFVELQPPFNQYEHGSDTEGGYLNMLHYTDWAIGEFIEKFKRRKDFDDTIFMITADHALAHFQSNDPYARFRVPLIVYAPKLIKPHSSQKFGAQTDLLPTIINLLDLEGSYATIGRDLFQPNPGFAVVKDGALVNIFTPQGFLQHSLKQIVDKQLTREDPSGSTQAGLEKKLIAFDHLTYHLLSKNRWFSQ